MSLVLSYIIKVRFEKYKDKVAQKDKMIFQQSKMAAMGEMLENIAHQWRQPLSVITSSSSGLRLQKEHNVLTDELLVDNLDNITKSAEHLSQTIDDFRDFYKNDKSKTKFDVKTVLRNAIELISSKLKNRKIEIVLDIDDIEILGYKNELIQVFMNILSNSNDVLDDAKIDEKVIKISAKQNDNNIVITFIDNGGGVEEQIASEIFDYRFTTKEHKSGTGIGLYMSRLIIEKAKGVIVFDNIDFEYKDVKYKGAKFTITLPF